MQQNNTEKRDGPIIQKKPEIKKSQYIRTDFVKIGSELHKEIIKNLEEQSRLVARIVEKCDIEVFNKNIIVLRFPTKSIYSESAVIYLDKIKKAFRIFQKFANGRFQIIPYVALLNNKKRQ